MHKCQAECISKVTMQLQYKLQVGNVADKSTVNLKKKKKRDNYLIILFHR